VKYSVGLLRNAWNQSILAPANAGALQPKGGKMKRYETVMIIDSDIPEEDRGPLFAKVKDQISQQGGVLFHFDEWGTRKMAYEVKRKHRGYYVRLDYCGEGRIISELERFCRIEERVLRYMTLQLSDHVDPEEIMKGMTEGQSRISEETKTPSQVQKEPSADAPEAAADEIKPNNEGE
jgi:small subunit ribosomal protein S6